MVDYDAEKFKSGFAFGRHLITKAEAGDTAPTGSATATDSFSAGMLTGMMLWRENGRAKKDTGLGWSADPKYLIHDAGTYLGYLYGWNRRFYKKYDGYAISVWSGWCYRTDYQGFITAPGLISTDRAAAVNSLMSESDYIEFDYLGLHWYANFSYGNTGSQLQFETPRPVVDFSGTITEIYKQIIDLAGVTIN